MLDERGRPREEFRRKAYNGALGQLMDGEWEQGRAALAAWVRRLRRYPAERCGEELADLCFDGEMELTLGDPEIGRVLLETVAAFPRKGDLVDPAIEIAERLLGRTE